MKTQNYHFLNQEIDISEHFNTLGNVHFNVNELNNFDSETKKGFLCYNRFERKGRIAFNMYSTPFESSSSWAFPPVYTDTPTYPFQVEFISKNVLRIKTTYISTQKELIDNDDTSLMLDGKPTNISVKPSISDTEHAIYKTDEMEVEIVYSPFKVIVKDKNGKELTQTLHSKDSMCLQNHNPLPLSYVRSSRDMHKYPAVSLAIHPNEHFYGCGESFTTLDKLGQKIVLYTKDPNGVETDAMYKPIPFFMSSRGYGVFYHTSAPMTLDFGKTYAEAQTAFIGEEHLDMFIFVGEPKEILSCYTKLTGKSPTPPLWSFGLWMSRISYKDEKETREVASLLKENRIPCDVIHLDTNWFEEDWLCNYKFSANRFTNPKKMMEDLKTDGYRTCLWQIPYFTPKNELFPEILQKNLAVKSFDGELPTDDAILDFSNPDSVEWYQQKLKDLFDIGVCAIKADFGEASPVNGLYYSGKSGFMEHNLYPIRYNKAVYDITKKITGDGIIWGRSAWAGSQRYPIHWGGDCENTNMGMLCSLRGGLSLGNCGFSFWSHDVGGFVRKSPEELYNRWTFMGIFTSHMRCHGAPPKEPWAYSADFLNNFRHMLELRYKLMPYIYAQSIYCTNAGLPLVRAMFIENPDDQTCATLDDQYYFGNDIIVAPLFEENCTRNVYLPKGKWIELGTNKVYEGEKWAQVTASVYPGLAFIRNGAAIPMVAPALTTDAIDWSTMKYILFSDGTVPPTGLSLDASNYSISKIDANYSTINSKEVSL